MSKQNNHCCEKFKTSIGGQALIEGIMMRGPEKDAVVVRGKDGISVEVTPRKIREKGSFATLPLIRGAVNFFDSQVVGVKALMRSADLAPEEYAQEEEPSKLDVWLEKKLGNEKFQQFVIGFAVFLGLAMSVGLFFILPAIISGFFDRMISSPLLLTLIEGVIRIMIFMGYMLLVSKMKEMKRVFSYHGAEHKTIRCYEAGLPLTVDNVRAQTRLHPRCGTSFLLVVMIISVLVFSVASTLLLAIVPSLDTLRAVSPFAYRLIMLAYKLILLPVIVSITYEVNRWIGRHDNAFTRALAAPGMWMQKFTTNEPDYSMIEVGITALKAVLPEQEEAGSMVKQYATLYLQARHALLEKEDAPIATMMARTLLSFVTGRTQESLLSNGDLYATEEECAAMEMGLNRLLDGEPLAYVLGEWDFYGLKIFVNENVLIPRDDTCAVTTLAIEQGIFLPQSPRILDLCCGSGCIGLAVASRISDARATLADISKEALAVAKKNITYHKLSGRVSCVSADALAMPPAFLGKFDLIVSNPPYITTAEMPELEPSVRDFEPHLALCGGEDGLDFYRSIIQNYKNALKKGGFIAFEFGEGQGDAICDILIQNGFTVLKRATDYHATERAVLAQYGREEE